MPVEIEAKIQVEDLQVVRDRLKQADAQLIGRFLEENIIFDTQDRSLLAGDRGLRVRCSREGESSHSTITYKGPRRPGDLKTRDETEVAVDDFASSVALLEQLGYCQVLSYQKRRETWKLLDCKVELDQVPRIGCFVEIEGASENLVQCVREKLLLGDRPLIKTSYVGLLMSHLQERGAIERRVSF